MRSRDAGSRAAGDRRDAEGVPTEPSPNSARTIVKRPRGSWAAQDLKRVPHTLRYTESPINGRASFARPVDHWKRTACTHLNPGERGGVAGYHSFTLCIDVSKRHAFPSTPPSTLGQKNPPPPCAPSEPQAARGEAQNCRRVRKLLSSLAKSERKRAHRRGIPWGTRGCARREAPTRMWEPSHRGSERKGLGDFKIHGQATANFTRLNRPASCAFR